MNRYRLALWVALSGAAACGDDADEPPVTPVTCTDGTILDEETSSCVIDPAACQGGTVLIDGVCKDPATDVTVDVEEAAEPNALGVGGESSNAAAGELALPAEGTSLVIKGTIVPRADADEDGAQEADYDTYLFTVSAPTLLEVTVDGLNGLAGGFAALDDGNGVGEWIRIGVNTTGDTTKRQVFVPQAGTYAIVIADTRTLMAGTADGGPNATYYATVKALPLPVPTPIAITDGLGAATGTIPAHEVRFFTAALGNGLNEIRAITYQRDVIGSLVVDVNNTMVALASEEKGANDFEATYVVGGVEAADTTLIVLDQQINSGNGSSAFRIDVQSRTATALSTSGGTASASQKLAVGELPSTLDGLSAFYFDAAADQSVGLNLAWSVPVDGLVFHERGGIASVFSWDPFFGSLFGFAQGFGHYTWSEYKGVFRAPAAGRYYVVVNAPETELGETIEVTSTIAATPPAQLAFGGTGVVTAPHPAFNSVPFEYLGSTERWQAFTVDADASAGGATLDVFDPDRAFGTLDPIGLRGDWGNGPGETLPVMVDAEPMFTLAPDSELPAISGRLMSGVAERHYVKVRTGTGAGQVRVAVTAREYSDEGFHAGPYEVTHEDEPFHADTHHRYLLRTEPRSVVTVTVTPGAVRDAAIHHVNAAELPESIADDGGAGVAEQLVVVAGDDGRVAIDVHGGAESSESPLTRFDITFQVAGPPAPFYAIAQGSTAWSNACVMGSDITPFDYDDGLTGTIAVPAGFTFHGEPVTGLRVSTNGWLTFDTTASIDINDSRAPQRFPSLTAPNAVVSPLWVDMTNVRICTKQVGTKLIVQWRGDVFGSNILVATQAIFDGADNSIELVYAPFIQANGELGGAGVENADGTEGQLLFFNSAGFDPGTSVKLTP